MKIKKILVIISVTLFSSVLLTACGDNNEQVEPKATTDTAVEKVAEKISEKDIVKKDKQATEKTVEEPTKELTAEDKAKKAAAEERGKQIVQATIDSAKNAISNASQSGFGWTNWKKMVEKAESAFKEDFTTPKV